MRVVVTGGAGFIGGHVVERLVAAGHPTLVIDDLSTGAAENLPGDVELVERSFAEPASLAEIAAFRAAAIVHLAAQIDAARSVDDPVADARTNVVDTLRLLELCRRERIARFVFASSAAVYGPGSPWPVGESAAGAPATPYGVAKLAVEGYLEIYRRSHGLHPAALRFANVYGPRQGIQGEGGVVALFARALAAAERPTIFGDGRQTRDFVHVDDVADAVVLALGAEADGCFNVSTAVETEVGTVYRHLAARLAPGLEPRFAPPRAGDVPRSALSYAAIAGALGWRPRIGVEPGLAATADWFRARSGRPKP